MDMISFLRGTISWVEEEKVVLDVGGLGYGVFMSGRALASLPSNGTEVLIYTYLSVREDAMQLYGFLSRDELAVFKLAISVSGIGPKGALGLLTSLSPDDLRFAVASKDVKAISAAPGIGKKTAEKLIVELKDKLKLEDALEHTGGLSQSELAAGDSKLVSSIQKEAVEALCALGYGNTEALKAVRQVEIGEDTTVEDALKLSLKFMTR